MSYTKVHTSVDATSVKGLLGGVRKLGILWNIIVFFCIYGSRKMGQCVFVEPFIFFLALLYLKLTLDMYYFGLFLLW
jgi:hypothetical protein